MRKRLHSQIGKSVKLCIFGKNTFLRTEVTGTLYRVYGTKRYYYEIVDTLPNSAHVRTMFDIRDTIVAKNNISITV